MYVKIHGKLMWRGIFTGNTPESTPHVKGGLEICFNWEEGT
jgi:hypothetical protein